MSKHKSAVVTGAGFLAAFNHKLFDAAKQAGVSEEQLYDLLNGDADFVTRLVKVFVESAGPVAQNLATMIADGKFREVDINITEANFPLSGPVADVADMLTVTENDLGGQDMTTFEIEAAIDQKGYRPATLAEQLAYAKAKWNGRDMVVALGSTWVDPNGTRYVSYLYEGDDGRELGLLWTSPDDGWHEDCLFLVVPK